MVWTVIRSITALMLLLGAMPGSVAAANATPTSTGYVATDPLAARLGGPKASFEAKYGLPVAGIPAMSNTATYIVNGFGQVAVVTEGTTVVAISAIADRVDKTSLTTPDSKDWNIATATRLARSFLPADATYRAEPITASGKVTGDCQSAALAKAIGRSLMAKLGVRGQAGDCSYILTEDANGDVSAFTVAIGSTGVTSQAAGPVTPSTPASANATKIAGASTSGGDDGAAAKHCADFETWAEAQSYFESFGGDSSPQGRALDADHDGKACESLK